MDSWRTFLPSLGTVISSPLRFWRKFARSDGKKLRGFKWMQLEKCISKHVKNCVRNQLALSWWFWFLFFWWIANCCTFWIAPSTLWMLCMRWIQWLCTDLPVEVLCVGWWLLKKHPRSGIPLIIYPTLMPLWAQFVWVISAHLVWVNPGLTCCDTIGSKYVLN